VFRIDGTRALVQTVDFFTPVVDDPGLFGEIAAANSLSDIYAMGATPVLGLALAMFPTDKLPLSVLEEILAGGGRKALEAGFPIAGGHTMIDDTPKYGLAVTGFVDVDRIVRNSTACPGDGLFLTKPIGNGILVSAYRAVTTSSRLRRSFAKTPRGFDVAVDWMTKLNREAANVMGEVGVSAATDVTGYGFIGHLLEMCEGSGVGARIEVAEVPVLEGTRDYVRKGFAPAGSIRNESSFRDRVRTKSEEDYRIMCDAQTSGGLLMAVPKDRERSLVDGFAEANVFLRKVGEITDGEVRIDLE